MIDEERTLSFDGNEFLRVPVHARVRPSTVEEVPEEVRPHIKATADEKQQLYWQDSENPDLVWVNFVLDSEGINKNYDYMPRTQLLASYHTAKHKPMDMEHTVKEKKSMIKMDRNDPPVKNTIFGVMTNTALANYEGKLLTAKQIDKIERTDDAERPDEEKITVVAWAALYYFLFPETVKDLVKVITSGDMYVSMERWLRKWDFLVAKTEGSDDYETVTREDAEKNGIFLRWQQKQWFNGAPVVRRTIAYSYGGVASTVNPANDLSRFLDRTKESRVKAAAALADSVVMKQLSTEHDSVVARYASASDDDERAGIVIEHARLHRAIAAYIG